MNIYELKTKNGETINKVNAVSIDEATEIFARIKNLTIDSLLELFVINKMNNK
jgi:hypothetical protein